MSIIRIMRGLPGSGKSTRAKQALEKAKAEGKSAIICSADDFFMKGGKYEFDPKKIFAAHRECFDTFIEGLYARYDLVIVDNTNIKLDEFEIYMKVGAIANLEVQIDGKRPKDDAEILMWHKRCVHDVPLDKVRSRAQQWQDIPSGWRVVYV
jgi:AAA domain-containing protein